MKPQSQQALVTFDLEATTKQIEMLAAYFNAGLEPQVLRIYVDALRDVPIEHLRAGCRRCIVTQRFMPKVAEIRAAIDAELQERERVTSADAPPTRELICSNCDDSGWVFVAERTDRAQPTVKRCPCYQTNPSLVTPKTYNHEEKRR